MLEITYEALRNPNFITGVRKIMDCPVDDLDEAIHLSRLCDDLTKVNKEAADVFEKLVKSYGNVSDDGRFKIDDAKIDDWKKAHAKFLEHPVKVNHGKIRKDVVAGAKLSPNELLAIQPLLDLPS